MSVRDTLAWLEATTDPEIMQEVHADEDVRRLLALLDYLDRREAEREPNAMSARIARLRDPYPDGLVG